MKTLSLFAVLLGLASTPAMAQNVRIEFDVFRDLGATLAPLKIPTPSATQTVWVCTFTNTGSDWVPKVIAITLQNTGAATVVDPVLQHFNQAPARASIYRNDDRIFGARWRLKSIRDKRHQRAQHMDFTLRYNKKRNKASLDLAPFGFVNSFNGRGTCDRRTN